MPDHQRSLFDAPIVSDPFQSEKKQKRNREDHGLLALDIATKTGFCYYNGSGVWDFKPKDGEHKDARLLRFKSKLQILLPKFGIKSVVVEMPLIYTSKKRRPNFISFEMLGILKLFCIENGIKCTGIQASVLKKWATGSGAARKEKMIEFCIKKYGVIPGDHNEADSIHLYHMELERTGIIKK